MELLGAGVAFEFGMFAGGAVLGAGDVIIAALELWSGGVEPLAGAACGVAAGVELVIGDGAG